MKLLGVLAVLAIGVFAEPDTMPESVDAEELQELEEADELEEVMKLDEELGEVAAMEEFDFPVQRQTTDEPPSDARNLRKSCHGGKGKGGCGKHQQHQSKGKHQHQHQHQHHGKGKQIAPSKATYIPSKATSFLPSKATAYVPAPTYQLQAPAAVNYAPSKKY